VVYTDGLNSCLHNPNTCRTPSGDSEVCLRKLWKRRPRRSSLNLAPQFHGRSAIHAPSPNGCPPRLTISLETRSRRRQIRSSVYPSPLNLSHTELRRSIRSRYARVRNVSRSRNPESSLHPHKQGSRISVSLRRLRATRTSIRLADRRSILPYTLNLSNAKEAS